MFSLEFASGRPLGSAPYYSLVVREPYIVGRDRGVDIVLDHGGIALRHASLTVMRESQALRLQQKRLLRHGEPDDAGDNGGEVVGSFLNDAQAEMNGVVSPSHPKLDGPRKQAWEHDDPAEAEAEMPPSQLHGEDPLVLRVVNLRDGGDVLANETAVLEHPAYLTDGAQLQFGAHICLRLRFRPLVVSIARSTFSADYVRELELMYYRLGATTTGPRGPTPLLDMPQPIGRLHCADAINDDPWCLMALACGYSIVQPKYVFEWFAALAQGASSPLTVLPPPVRFEVPIQWHGATAVHAAFYLRPESDVCPFPLYPIPTTAARKRSRDALFKGKRFFFVTNAVELRYKQPLLACGGEVLHLEDVVTITAEAAAAAEGCDEDGGASRAAEHGDPAPDARKKEEAANSAAVKYYLVVDADTEAVMRLNDVPALGSLQSFLEETDRAGLALPIIAERSLFHSLLTNRFIVCEVAWPAPAEHATGGNELPDTAMTWDARIFNFTPRTARGASQSRRLLDVHARTQSPRTGRRREPAMAELTKPQRRGRHPHAAARDVMAANVCDALRLRVRAFVLREGAKLQENLAGSWRNLFVDAEVLEHARECQIQSVGYLDKLEGLLPELGENPRLASEICGFQQDCHEVLRTAQEIVEIAKCAAQRSQHPSRPRRLSLDGALLQSHGTSIGGRMPYRSLSSEVGRRRETAARESSKPAPATQLFTPRGGAKTSLATPRSSRGKSIKKTRTRPAADAPAPVKENLGSEQTDPSVTAPDTIVPGKTVPDTTVPGTTVPGTAAPQAAVAAPRQTPLLPPSHPLPRLEPPSVVHAHSALRRIPRTVFQPPQQPAEPKEEVPVVTQRTASGLCSTPKRTHATHAAARGLNSSINSGRAPSSRLVTPSKELSASESHGHNQPSPT
ncbi:uncharacterized protein Tco025E_01123, partial [Trypanosoma conorhini]